MHDLSPSSQFVCLSSVRLLRLFAHPTSSHRITVVCGLDDVTGDEMLHFCCFNFRRDFAEQKASLSAEERLGQFGGIPGYDTVAQCFTKQAFMDLFVNGNMKVQMAAAFSWVRR